MHLRTPNSSLRTPDSQLPTKNRILESSNLPCKGLDTQNKLQSSKLNPITLKLKKPAN